MSSSNDSSASAHLLGAGLSVLNLAARDPEALAKFFEEAQRRHPELSGEALSKAAVSDVAAVIAGERECL